MDNRPIGVFDSGVGGMTVLKELKQKLPNENFIYLGDTKRFPYGSKSKETIIELTKSGIEFLIKQDVKCIVIACGTATSQALPELKQNYNLPIIGVLEPTVNYIEKIGKTQIGVIATSGTIHSKGWEKSIHAKLPNANIQSISCPLLAPLVEEGWNANKIAKLMLKEYLKPFHKIEVLILGCTHYPLLQPLIQKQLGKRVEIINIGTHVAFQTKETLKNAGKLAENNEKPNIICYLTEAEEKFSHLASSLLGISIPIIEMKEETSFLR